jgi:methylmalonyl-CoA/ethylmalonyl-CoA epimerase
MSLAPSLKLHHVGYAVRQIEATAETYCNRFGYVAATGAIHDPLQTAFVQFLALPGDSVYLELVAPDGPESKLAHASKRGGLNHLCYTCGPLEATIAALQATEMTLISDPKPGIAFGGRRICWMVGLDPLPIELVERRDAYDLCIPGI